MGKAPELKLEAEERFVVNGVRVVTMDSPVFLGGLGGEREDREDELRG